MRSLPEWIGATDDSPIPARVKVRIYERQGGRCVRCNQLVGGRLRPEYDHVTPFALAADGTANREGNLQLLCHVCHRDKTDADVAAKAKAQRIVRRRAGIRKPRSITQWRRFNGDPVRKPRQRE